MKKINKIIIILALFVGISLIANLVLMNLVSAESSKGKRYYISSSEFGLEIARTMVGTIHHKFEYGFTTDLSPGQIKALEILGYQLEEVPLYYVTGKPTCNDNGICEPELGENPSCQDCKAEDGEEVCSPTEPIPWGIEKVNGGGESDGTGVTVAVLDTGVMANHPDLTVAVCKDTTKGPNIKNGCKDGNGHGTHVAGTIAANGEIVGVAPAASLMAIKVCGASGSCWSDDIAAGIYYAADNGAHIINLSLGGNTPSSLIKDATNYATASDVLIVAAAGNDGPGEDTIDYPAAYPEVIAVGAIDSEEAVPEWSSRGINDGDDSVISEKEIEFGAPGVGIESAWNDGCYKYLDGTSMSTPHVSGVAAKSWQYSASETRTYLWSIAKDIDTGGYDTATGYGVPIAE